MKTVRHPARALPPLSPAIAHHEAAAQVEPEIVRGIEQKAWGRLPATDTVGIVVKTDVHGRYLDAFAQFPVDFVDHLARCNPRATSGSFVTTTRAYPATCSRRARMRRPVHLEFVYRPGGCGRPPRIMGRLMTPSRSRNTAGWPSSVGRSCEPARI